MTSQGFYVYTHHRSTDGDVFYVGKGCGRRAWVKDRDNRAWRSIARKHGFEARIVWSGLDEELALLAERELIDKLRRLGTRLANQTDGGDGLTRPSEEIRSKLSASLTLHFKSADARQAAADRTREAWTRQDVRDRHREAVLAAMRRDEVKTKHASAISDPSARARNMAHMLDPVRKAEKYRKISEANRALLAGPRGSDVLAALKMGAVASRKPVVCEQTGQVFESASAARDHLRASGHPLAGVTHISLCAHGKRKTAYGFTWRWAESRTPHRHCDKNRT